MQNAEIIQAGFSKKKDIKDACCTADIFIHFQSLSTIFNHFHPPGSTCILPRPPVSTCIYFRPLSHNCVLSKDSVRLIMRQSEAADERFSNDDKDAWARLRLIMQFRHKLLWMARMTRMRRMAKLGPDYASLQFRLKMSCCAAAVTFSNANKCRQT